MNQKVFLIRSGMDGITSHFYEKSIGISGRSVYDIHIGDLLIYNGMQYLVISMIAYRRELKKIGDGMTCELERLEVIGKQQEFQTDSMMYKIDADHRFQYREQVVVKSKPWVTGEVSRIEYHWNRKEAMYFLRIEGKLSKKRYFEGELDSAFVN